MNQTLYDKLNPNWYSIAIVNLLVLGLLMLFFKELPDTIKSYLIPALVVYVLGNGIIGYIQGSYFRANGMKNDFKEPLKIYYFLYAVWFVLFIVYLFFRHVI